MEYPSDPQSPELRALRDAVKETLRVWGCPPGQPLSDYARQQIAASRYALVSAAEVRRIFGLPADESC